MSFDHILLIYLLCKNIYSDLIPIFSHFFILSFMSYLYILDISLLLFISFANIFSHSGGCLSVLFMVSFAQQVFWGIYYIPGAVLRCVNAALIKYRQESWVPLGAAVPLWPLHSALCLLYLWSCDDDLVIFIPFLGRFWLNQIPTTEPSHTNWQPWLGSWFGYWPLLGPQTPA